MKNLFHSKWLVVLAVFFTLSSCGPVLVSSRPNVPPPSWFYPNRVETMRYVYFPDYQIYYDVTFRNYIYLDNGVWLSASVLPSRFSTINLRKSKYVRVRDYYGDNIREYHRETYNRGRSNVKNRRDK
ncbi:hypothetical protein L1I30_05705 [Gillisia sp. M10.2A]|uniref:Lipoprotein n=1 Tax=Gillisia lutea TaxID=2909668 RepID=A0ABS9EFW7_9FLAO|nr:hypothetical protein [Gillisia lutea]MCF4101152.1 hypothetical protein [Gillisia lutea]